MKIAILLRGITYVSEYTTSGGIKQSVDWKWTRDNIMENVVNSFPNADIYLTSYRSVEESFIVEYFNPTSYIFHCLSPMGCSEMDCLLDGLRLIKQSKNVYEGIFISRFDLHYYEPVLKINFDYNKINFLYKEFNENSFNAQGKCANGAWFIPSSGLGDFINSCEQINGMTEAEFKALDFTEGNLTFSINLHQKTHYIYHSLIKIVNQDMIHFLTNSYFNSDGGRHVCLYYKLVRSIESIPEISSSYISILGSIIYTTRNLLSYSQESVSRNAAIDLNRYKKIEIGECNLTVIEFLNICSAISADPWKVLKLVSEMPQLY